MITNKHVSLIIPVYNEADRIRDCLDAVARQSVMPLEVIVVDNNSTDGTAVIAQTFPFVTVLQERKQGVVHARDRGFNAARGDIIARIDADTIIANGWIETLQAVFAAGDVDMVSGLMRYRDMTMARTVSRIDLFWRRRMARLLGDEVALQGANMAINRRVWTAIRHELCHASGLHEDFDLAVHGFTQGFKATFDERLVASICYRQADYNFKSFKEYTLISPRTYLEHGVTSGRHMYQVVAFVLVLYPIISLLSRGYDKRLGRFSIVKLFASAVPPRVNPATFVD
jgi:glycosyltransferase involved in cell wall biosynthesis